MNSSDNTPENPQVSHHRQRQSDNDPDQTQKRAQKFSIESLRNNLQEISQETRENTQELPAEVDVKALAEKVAELDKKQRIWLFFYLRWLYFYAGTILLFFSPAHFKFVEIASRLNFIAKEDVNYYANLGLILATSIPCIILIIAKHKKSLRLANIGLKVTIIGMFITFGFIIGQGFYIYFMKYQELSINNGPQFSLDEEMKKRLIFTLMQTGGFLLVFFVTYGGGRKLRNYLIQREKLLKNKME